MKKLRISLLCLAVAAVLITACGCSKLMAAMEDEKTRGYTDLVLDAIVAEDVDTAYAVFEQITTKDNFTPVFYEMKNMMKDVAEYELKLLSVYRNTNYSGGASVTEISSVYEMTSGESRYIVDVKTRSDVLKLSSFYVSPYEETNYYYTGTVDSMKDMNALQWIFLLSNLLVIGLSVFAIVDCATHKIKLKALWIVIIAIGFVSVGLTLSQQNVNFNFNLGWITAYTAIVRYGGGMTVVRFMLPVGAVLYFCLRGVIKKKPAPEPQIVYYQDDEVNSDREQEVVSEVPMENPEITESLPFEENTEDKK